MSTVYKALAYGKINLHLDVLNRMENGYHNIESIMQSVSLADEITLEISNIDTEENIIEIASSNNSVPTDNTEDTHASETSGSYSTDSFVKVGAKDLASLSKGKSIVVWIGRQGCGYCTQYVPTITSVGEKLGIDIHYLDLSDIFDLIDKTNSTTDLFGTLDAL